MTDDWHPRLCEHCAASVEKHAAEIAEGRGVAGDIYCEHNRVYAALYMERGRVIDVSLRNNIDREQANRIANEAVLKTAAADRVSVATAIQ